MPMSLPSPHEFVAWRQKRSRYAMRPLLFPNQRSRSMSAKYLMPNWVSSPVGFPAVQVIRVARHPQRSARPYDPFDSGQQLLGILFYQLAATIAPKHRCPIKA